MIDVVTAFSENGIDIDWHLDVVSHAFAQEVGYSMRLNE